MKPAGYRDIQPGDIPVLSLPGGGQVKVIAGTAVVDGRYTPGAINGAKEKISTDPLYLDVELPAGGKFTHPINSDYNAFIYAYEGSVSVGSAGSDRPLQLQSAGVLSPGDRLEVSAGSDGARFILLAGRPLREPVAQYGPFVMNTREQIEQAIQDYQSGALTRVN
jgi:hypothetical protein